VDEYPPVFASILKYFLISGGGYAVDKVQSVSRAYVGHVFLVIVCDECVNDQCSVSSISQGRCQDRKWQSSGMVKDLSNMNSSSTPDYIYILKITYEVDDESESLRVWNLKEN
jgi:hypothetical protein